MIRRFEVYNSRPDNMHPADAWRCCLYRRQLASAQVNDLTLQLNGISVQLRGLQADTNHLGDSNQALVHQALLLQVFCRL